MEISLKTFFAALAIIIGAFGFWPYLRDMFRQKTKPHAYTWLIWVITQGTATAALWFGGGGWGAISMTFGTTICFLVFLFSFKYGTKNIVKSDTFVLIAALGSIVVWWQLESPLLAVLMVTAIDVVGYWPSFRKSFQEPWSETMNAWLIFALSNFFAILALNEYNWLTLTYITAISLANLALFAICLFRRQAIPAPVK